MFSVDSRSSTITGGGGDELTTGGDGDLEESGGAEGEASTDDEVGDEAMTGDGEPEESGGAEGDDPVSRGGLGEAGGGA